MKRTKKVIIPEVVETITLDKSLQLIQDYKNKRLEIDTVKKGLGLQLALIAIAENNVTRLPFLTDVINQLERKVFDPKAIKEASRRELIALYQLANDITNNSAKFIDSTLNTVDWEYLKSLLNIDDTEIKETKKLEAGSINKLAKQLLKIATTNDNVEKE